MNKILYIVDKDEQNDYHYDISEDTIIYHYSINCSTHVELNLVKEGVKVYYYNNVINYDDNTFTISVNHKSSNTHSELYNHGVNVLHHKFDFIVNGSVSKESSKCICNQENQIINMKDGKSTIFPNLFIDNYDVESSHSAYIGKFSFEKVFYMMSRGISKEDANHLLLNGFLIGSDSIDLHKIELFVKEIEKI